MSSIFFNVTVFYPTSLSTKLFKILTKFNGIVLKFLKAFKDLCKMKLFIWVNEIAYKSLLFKNNFYVLCFI